jgi:Flp pilus assembly protein TadB
MPTYLGFALLHAIGVLIVYALIRNKVGIVIGAAGLSVVAVFAGNPIYTVLDLLFTLGAAWFLWRIDRLRPRRGGGSGAPANSPVEVSPAVATAEASSARSFRLHAPEPTVAKPGKSKLESIGTFLGAIFAIFIIVYGLAKIMAPPPVVQPAQAPVLSAYAQALAIYRERYPQLDPTSPSFNQKVADRVAETVRQSMKAGKSTTEAFDLAISEVIPSQKRGANQRQARSEPTGSDLAPSARRISCEYKSVMTDEELKACGIASGRP